jgi:uncharacterized protein
MEQKKFTLSILESRFGICKLKENSEINPEVHPEVPSWVHESNFFSITRTPEELSVVCQENRIPADIKAEKDWKCLKIEGPLDFELTGILAGVSRVLADCEIAIFVISTYDTDYILIREKDLESAVKVLLEAGYGFSNKYCE